MKAFAAALLDLVEGRSSPADLQRRFGHGGSPREDLAFYAEMVHRQRRVVLDTFYATARVAGSRRGLGWARVADRYIVERPPRHPNPSVWALELGAFAREIGALEDPLVNELMNFACARYRAMHVAQGPRVQLDVDVLVRLYEHDVPSICHALERDERAEPDLSPGERRPLVIARSRTTGHLVVRSATFATLVVLKRSAGSDDEVQGAPGEDVLREEQRRLISAGILPPPP